MELVAVITAAISAAAAVPAEGLVVVQSDASLAQNGKMLN